MKAIVKIIFCILIFSYSLVLGASGSYKNKYEKMFVEFGQFKVMEDISKEFNFSEQDLSYFIFKNSEIFENDRNEYLSRVNSADTSEQALENMKNLFISQAVTYHTLARKYSQERNLKTEEYKNLVREFNQYRSTTSVNTLSFPIGPCDNNSFENAGSLSDHTYGWNFYLGKACYSSSIVTCNDFKAATYTAATAVDRIKVMTSGYDPIVGGTILPVLPPLSTGGYSLRLENTMNGFGVTKVAYSFKVAAGSLWYKYQYAAVLEDPGDEHSLEIKPYFSVRFYDTTSHTEISCASYKVYASSSPSNRDMDYFENFIPIVPGSSIKFKPWTDVVVPLDASYTDHIITAEFTVSDCGWGGHFGYAYIDGECDNGNIIQTGNCASNFTLTAPPGFKSYHWAGDSLAGDNDKNIAIYKGGRGQLIMRTEGGCEVIKTFRAGDCGVGAKEICMLVVPTLSKSTCNPNDNTYSAEFTFVKLADLNDVKYKDYRIKITIGDYFEIFEPKFEDPVLPLHPKIKLEYLKADGNYKNVRIQLFKDGFTSDEEAICDFNIDNVDHLDFTAPAPYITSEIACLNCIDGFAPVKGAKYVLSAWVTQKTITDTATGYYNPSIKIEFRSVTDVLLSSTSYYAKGKMIEGWQRIYDEIEIPLVVDYVKIFLLSASDSSYFDDIRIYPLTGSLKSYVYDPVSLKLVATLDENNYATFYEYDKEGTLIRTKKETERGIITISENRQNNPKRN